MICLCVKTLWHSVENVLRRIENLSCNFTCKDVILGFHLVKPSSSTLVVNNVILHVKMYLWKCKLLHFSPSYTKLKEFIANRKVYEDRLEFFYDNM